MTHEVISGVSWARTLEAQLQATAAQLALVRQSRWLKLGRQIGLGPRLAQDVEEPAK